MTEPNSPSSRIAGEIRAALARARIPQTDVADALNMSQASVSRRLTGDTPLDVNELQVIADLVGVPMVEFLRAGAPT